ncbi:hypothetical protein [Pseudonocardia sp.]|uniref:hypothetical protein n=1 Tax=Pseudonocardia sp. TaxID=60912 RepID=UPI003D0F624C
MCTVDRLAEHLAVDPGDVEYLARTVLGTDDVPDRLPDEVAGELRMILNPHSERTVLELWWPGAGIVGEDGSRVEVVRRIGPR